MKQIEVSREFLDEFEKLDINGWLYNALIDIDGSSTYRVLDKYLYRSGLTKGNSRMLEFAEVWAGKAEYVAKEKLYYVKLLKTDDCSYLIKREGHDEYFLDNKKWYEEGYKNKFTEQEIKDINPAYCNDTFLELVKEN